MFREQIKNIVLLDNTIAQHSQINAIIQFLDCQTLAFDQADDTLLQSGQVYFAILTQSEISAHGRLLNFNIPALLLASHPSDMNQQDNAFIGQLDQPLKFESFCDVLHQINVFYARIKQAQHQLPKCLYQNLVGHSDRICELRELIFQVAKKNSTVLILGESGTGKEVVARTIHQLSEREAGPFIPVNCGAIPSELLESELFGHEKGAFTGAVSSRAGRFEQAQGGTLFLDEIGDMPPAMQVKILRVLQEKIFERVGGSKSIKADVRIIAATHRNLEQAITEGKFREDLYYRLNVFPIEMPTLRDRHDDLVYLIDDLIYQQSTENQCKPFVLSQDAFTALLHYAWPGNIRELSNLIERLLILYAGDQVGLTQLPRKFHVGRTPSHIDMSHFKAYAIKSSSQDQPNETLSTLTTESFDLKSHLAQLERQYIMQALNKNENIVAHAATQLKMRRTTLVEKIKKYGLMVDRLN